MFTEKDLDQFKAKKISKSEINSQINSFNKGFPFLNIEKIATIDDGIIKLDNSSISKYIELYDSFIENKRIVKFVPASGAASRMFKDLYSFMEKYNGKDDIEKNPEYKNIHQFFSNLGWFAFLDDLREVMKNDGLDFDNEYSNKKYITILTYLLTEKGLNFGSLPKALIKFHKYPKENRTAFEEHLVESSSYCISSDGKARIHYTIAPEYLEKFKEITDNNKPTFRKKYNVSLDVTFSIQKPSTDTISVDINNIPFRDADGKILFRPGGHGALIENLNDINADIIFIKNIDNIVPDKFKQKTIIYKKVIGGVLGYYTKTIHGYLTKINNRRKTSANPKFDEIFDFIEKELCVINKDIRLETDNDKIIEYINMILNRPIRVCGMVKNEGEPGGGPFWVVNSDKSISLQIVESSQINHNDTDQESIYNSSTHFNPVDIVCYVKDYEKNKFDLSKYVDTKTGFISTKSKDGKELKALELPGLWNGAMSNWNTIFVEVPIITFNPVKTVNDLLRDEHKC